MEEQRNELQVVGVGDPEGTDKIFVFGCPYLGTLQDPDTSLAYPAPANHCFRAQSPTSIDLEHQETFCLSDQHPSCHVFQMSVAAGAETERVAKRRAPKKRKRRVSLYALPLILILILLAAIVWWPAPGTTIQDSLARGAQSVREVSGGATLTGEKPVSVPAQEQEEPVAAETNSADELASAALDAAEGQQENAVAQNEEADAGLDSPAPVSINRTDEGATDLEADEAAVEQNAETAAAEQETSEQPQEAEAEAEAVTEETIAEEAAAEGIAGTAASQDTITDNYEADQIAFEASRETSREEPIEESIDEVFAADAAQEVEETEEAESVYTSDLPVISTEIAAVPSPAAVAASSPTAEPISFNGAGEQVVLVGPVTTTALSLGDRSEGANSLLIYRQAGDGAVLAELENKQFVTLLGRDATGAWLKVRLQDGREGWINAYDSGASGIGAIAAAGSTPAIASAPAATVATSYPVIRSAYVDTGALNLRSGPGVEYEAFTIIGKGQIVGLIGRRALGPWVRVRLDDGTEGWVNSSLLAPIS